MIGFDDSWKNWVETNLDAGCDRRLMYADMLKAGFEQDFILSQLKLNACDVPGGENYLYTPGSSYFNLINAGIRVVDAFLSEEECLYLQMLVRSGINAQGGSVSTAPIGAIGDQLANDIERRLCDFLGIGSRFSSGLVGELMTGSQENTAPVDHYAVHPEMGECSLLALIFTGEAAGGGEIEFPATGLRIKPKRGALIIWEGEAGEHDPDELERLGISGVSGGFQSLVFKNFYNHRAGFKKEANEYTEAYTGRGFLKQRIPDDLFHRILAFYFGNINRVSEEADKVHIRGKNDEISSEMIELPDEFKAEIHAALLPLAEAWIGRYLEPTFVFGIRRYLDTSVLKNHRDRQDTHVASAILNIAQDVRKPWPLYIEDHHYRGHKVLLSPGDMVLYEGCKLKHGRPEPLDGDYFCNIFVHFRIKCQDPSDHRPVD
ncbi:MAG: hypothetical protein KDI44_18040 [Thiothrix sp.]|nr:hypothetical protein [Thiothrix sp.]